MDELWSKAQTTGEIINRSGTVFNSGINKDLAIRDAETRLQSGGGLFGKGGISVSGILGDNNKEKNTPATGVIAMSVNPYLWRAALETIDFMPLSSADQVGGTIITDWYSSSENENERCKLNIFVNGVEFKSQNLKVTTFCQIYKNEKWHYEVLPCSHKMYSKEYFSKNEDYAKMLAYSDHAKNLFAGNNINIQEGFPYPKIHLQKHEPQEMRNQKNTKWIKKLNLFKYRKNKFSISKF